MRDADLEHSVNHLEISTGHASERAIQLVRLASDANRKYLIPHLVEKALHEPLQIEDLMSLRRTYFSTQPVIASMYTGDVVTNDFNMAKPETVFTGSRGSLHGLLSQSSVRAVDVRSSTTFYFPSWKHLDELGERYVQQINEFFRIARELPAPHREMLLYKFHMITSVLHLPVEGSGRLLGDIDTLLQNVLAIKTAGFDNPHVPQYISISGYRCGGDEPWSLREERLYRSALMTDLFNDLRQDYSALHHDFPKKLRFTNLNDNRAVSLLRRTFLTVGKSLPIDEYYASLQSMIRIQIRNIFDLDHNNWFNDFAKGSNGRRKYMGKSGEYFYADGMRREDVEILDTLVGLKNNQQYDLLSTVLRSSNVISPDFIKNNQKINRQILDEILEELFDWDESLYRSTVSENPYLMSGYSDI